MSATVPHTSDARQLVILRAVVAALGERATPPWWRTQFLTDAGLRAIARVFPRTALAAAVNSASIAARAEHDRLVGVGRRYHLFRLPNTMEGAIVDAMQERALQSDVAAVLGKGLDAAILQLDELAGDRVVPRAEGPVALGDAKRLHHYSGLEEIAAHYRGAFKDGMRCFPYFEEEK